MSDFQQSSVSPEDVASQLAAQAEHLYGATKRRNEAARAAEADALRITAESASPDGSVSVRVDAGGMLIDLALTAEALRARPTELATKVLEVAQRAAAQARVGVRQVYEPLRREGITRGIPMLLPAEPSANPTSPTKPGCRSDIEEEAPYDERTITRRRRRT